MEEMFTCANHRNPRNWQLTLDSLHLLIFIKTLVFLHPVLTECSTHRILIKTMGLSLTSATFPRAFFRVEDFNFSSELFFFFLLALPKGCPAFIQEIIFSNAKLQQHQLPINYCDQVCWVAWML